MFSDYEFYYKHVLNLAYSQSARNLKWTSFVRSKLVRSSQ